MDYKEPLEKRVEARVQRGVKKGVKIFFAVVFGAAVFLLAIYALQLLWNWLMPELFGLTAISYWQALGILVLAKLIFGMGGGCHRRGGKFRKPHRKNCRHNGNASDKWWYYDRFWKEEGAAAYEQFVARMEGGQGGQSPAENQPG